MRRIILLILALVMCLSLCACGNTAVNDELASLKIDFDEISNELDEISNELNEIKNENTKLKDENSSLEATIQSLEKELDVYKKAEEQAKKEKEVQVGDVTVTLVDKGQLPKNVDAWRFSDYVTFVFELSNNTDKDIQGIQGVATFNDLFGKKIISMNCDFTGETIPAGGSITVDDLTFEVNQFMSDHTKLYTTDYKDLKFEYQTTSIVFTDGTSKN